MKLPLLIIIGLASLSLCLADPPHKPGESYGVAAPIGRLGYPIGTYLTIEGVRSERGKVGTQSLLVDKIGDYKVPEPFGLWIENLELPEGVRCVLKGYESGQWIGTPDNVLKATGALPQQAAWQFHFHFLATSVEEPKDLKLKER